MSRSPLIGLCADSKLLEPHPFQCVGEKYIGAVVDAAGGLPLLVPSQVRDEDFEHLLDRLDGLVLPGSYANVHPSHYGGGEPYEGSPLDAGRDRAVLGLIPRAVRAGVPLLGICRGFQEINVALGGSLHQKLHEVPGFEDHREDEDDPLDVQYGEAHEVALRPGGMLATLLGRTSARVNSVHGQGVDRLAPGVTVEATAPDGVIEAFTVDDAPAFALAVQWHPEWKPAEYSFHAVIWKAFGEACRMRAIQRQQGERPWPTSAVS